MNCSKRFDAWKRAVAMKRIDAMKKFVVMAVVVAAALATGAAGIASAQEMQEGRLMRFPDIHKDKIVFSYGGDLWLVPSGGRSGAAHHHAPGSGNFSEVFSRREDHRVHGAVRREFRGVHDSSRGRGSQATDILAKRRARGRAHGPGRRGDQLASGREAHPVPLAPRHVQ